MAWTIDGTDIGALEDGIFSPDFSKRKPNIVQLNLAGTGIVEFHNVGYGPYQERISIWFTDAAKKTTLENKNGTAVTLSDGTTSWSAVVLDVQIRPIAGGAGGYQGYVDVARSAAS